MGYHYVTVRAWLDEGEFPDQGPIIPGGLPPGIWQGGPNRPDNTLPSTPDGPLGIWQGGPNRPDNTLPPEGAGIPDNTLPEGQVGNVFELDDPPESPGTEGDWVVGVLNDEAVWLWYPTPSGPETLPSQ